MYSESVDMVIHSILITAVLYAIMLYVFKQSNSVATDRSIFIGANVLIYMVLFGHSFPPGKMNPNINIFK